MIHSITSRSWLLVLGLTWLAATSQADAWQRPPVKVITKFDFQVEVKVGPQFARPTAPWYAYFPADAPTMPLMQTTPYPTWPQTFPPAAPQKSAAPATGPNLARQWPNYYGANVQPVGYLQAPSYWYQGR